MVTRKKRTRRCHHRRRRRHSTYHKKGLAGMPGRSSSSSRKNSSRERYFTKTKKIIKGDFELDKRTRREIRSKINTLYKPPQGIRSTMIGRPLNKQGRELLRLLNKKEREMRPDEISQ